MVALVHFHNGRDHLDLQWADGRLDRVLAIWLRDNSPSPEARHANGQKLFDITDLSPRPAIESVEEEGGTLTLRFAPDGHEARYNLAWLRAHLAHVPEPTRHLWGRELADDLPAHDWPATLTDEAAKRRWLGDLCELGFVLLRNVPTESGTLLEVAESFGHVRATNYGRFFEVRTEPDPINLAYTPMGLSCHTDNPYREPVPGLQLLHCLKAENDGGESVVVDGLHAAELLRDEAPGDFDLLARHAVPFRFASRDAVLEARAPMIAVDDRGAVREIRFNNRSIAAFDFAPEVMGPFYDAYRRFAEILQRPALEVAFKLRPGELFIVDNQRVLHGRRTVTGSGLRHLQGCYADKDGLHSTLALLVRGRAS